MIVSYTRILFAALLLLVAGSVHARNVDELMRKSGIWKQVTDFPAMVRAGADEARKKERASGKTVMTDAEYARLVAIFDRAFAPDRMRRIIAREIDRNLGVEDEAKMLAFLDSDLGKRATRLEEQASTPEMMKEAQENAAAYFLQVPGARVAKLMRLARAVEIGDASASMMINVAAALAYGAAVSAPNGDEREAKELRKQLQAKKPEMAEAMYQYFVKFFAYIYRPLSDEDLDRYIEFAQTPAAKHFTQVTQKAFNVAFEDGALEAGRNIGREAGKRDRTS